MKKVLHIIHVFGVGGAETWLIQVARYIHQHPEFGWTIDFLATGGEPAVYDNEIMQTGARIFYIKYSLTGIRAFRKDFTSLLKQEKYDAVHDHQDFVSGWHFLSALGYLPAKRVAHLHNEYRFVQNYITNGFRRFSFHAGRALMALLATNITGTSNAVMDEYGYNRRPYKNKRAAPAYCGFEVSEFAYSTVAREQLRKELQWDDDCHIALFVGRIDLQDAVNAKNQKNPEFALELAKRMIKHDPSWRFLFVGLKGKIGEQMEQDLRSLKMEEYIKFIGLRKDVPAIMSASDVLLFPSLGEGLGMVAVEAQANGLPVLAADTLRREAIVIPELVITKNLSEPMENWMHALAKAKRDRQQTASSNLSVERSHFSIQNSVKNLINLYS